MKIDAEARKQLEELREACHVRGEHSAVDYVTAFLRQAETPVSTPSQVEALDALDWLLGAEDAISALFQADFRKRADTVRRHIEQAGEANHD